MTKAQQRVRVRRASGLTEPPTACRRRSKAARGCQWSIPMPVVAFALVQAEPSRPMSSAFEHLGFRTGAGLGSFVAHRFRDDLG